MRMMNLKPIEMRGVTSKDRKLKINANHKLSGQAKSCEVFFFCFKSFGSLI